ncbi:hypothetical protein KDL44_02540 [bacterium]|nr:hypothetical protein [bacterium]
MPQHGQVDTTVYIILWALGLLLLASGLAGLVNSLRRNAESPAWVTVLCLLSLLAGSSIVGFLLRHNQPPG